MEYILSAIFSSAGGSFCYWLEIMGQKTIVYGVFYLSCRFLCSMNPLETKEAEDSDYEEVVGPTVDEPFELVEMPKKEEEPEPESEMTEEQEKTITEYFLKLKAFNLKEAEKAEEFTKEENALNLKVDKAISGALAFRANKTPAMAPIYSPFECKRPPVISFADYLARFREYTKFSHQVMIAAVIYMDRFMELPGVSFNSNTIHKIFLVALTLAQKTLLDDPFSNADMARVGLVSLDDLNNLERLFLIALKHNTFISQETYQEFETEILKSAHEESISTNK